MSNFIGSVIPAGTPASHVLSAPVLTVEGIMARHNLTFDEIQKIEKKLKSMKLLDILFHYPDGPRYDIALYLIATL